MIITAQAIKHRITVYVFVFLLVIMGLVSYNTLPREASPDITIPVIIVNTLYMGASPQDIENLITRPIEQEVQSIENIKVIRSSSIEGTSSITIEFNPNEDIDIALQRVKDKVDLVKPELPQDAEDPLVLEVNFSNIPMMLVTLSGDYGLIRLKEIAEDLADEIETIPGILEVRIAGGLEREVKVDVDPDRLAAYNLPIQDVVDAIRRENLSLPGGSIDLGTYKYTVRVPGELQEVSEIGGLLIKAENNNPIYVRDVADVTYGFKDRATYSRLNQNPSVTLEIVKRSGENLIGIADQIKTLLDETLPSLPHGTQVAILGDQSEDIRMMVKDLENNIISGLILVVAVLFLFMGGRNAVFVGIAIPFSMLMAFVIISALDMTLNMVVLFSLILALGMLVDNAIVIVENIYRHRQEGQSENAGAFIGTSEVAWPVITSTLTTLCAFAPMIAWPGIMGEFMKFLPITLIITLTSSLFVGLVINPTFCASFMNVQGSLQETSPRFQRILNAYQARLEWALSRPWTTLGLSVSTLVLVIIAYGFLGHGVEFFPEVEPNKAYIDVRAPSGTNLETSNALAQKIENILEETDNIKTYVANVGVGGGGDFSAGETVSHASRISIDFVDEAIRTESSFLTVEHIREALKTLTGADIEISKENNGPPVGAPVNVEISGENIQILGELAAKAKRIIARVPGGVDLKDDFDKGRPEIRVIINREAAGLLGLNTSVIAGTVRTAIYGAEASEYRVGEDEHDIRVRFQPDKRNSLSDLENILLDNDGHLVPLSAVAQVDMHGGFGSIRRKDLKRLIAIEGKVAGRTSDAVMTDVQNALGNFALPPGYQISYAGESEEQNKSAAFLMRAFFIALSGIVLILITQFNSLTLPFTILTSVILSLIGVLIGLMVTGTPFGIIIGYFWSHLCHGPDAGCCTGHDSTYLAYRWRTQTRRIL
ncbi:MAG: efflux RND transporter permease subunit [Candidatus Latescibacteria bacterium]|nr:efflux RND transporter permease subunit [Candidatus Latescibacterota bacterium]